MPTSSDGRRLRSVASREAILDAAEREFEALGYAATSIRRVAAAAEMSPPGVSRHFATKQAMFAALLERIQERNLAILLGDGLAAHPPAERMVMMAERLTSRRRETELYTVLLGEARSAGHPAHAYIGDQMAGVHARLGDEFGAAMGSVLHAAWDGLRLVWLYLPERIDPASTLGYRLRTPASGPMPSAVPRPALTLTRPAGLDDDSPEGRMLATAIAVFGETGYRDARIRDIAARAGVPHSTLLYHYATKEALLRGVLAVGGPESASQIPAGVEADAREFLRQVYEVASATARDTDLELVRSAIAFEAIERQHPANAYFVKRYRIALDRLIGVYESLQGQGRLEPGIDPALEAAWTMGLWEGLRIQSFYLDADGPAERIRTELNRSLVPAHRLS